MCPQPELPRALNLDIWEPTRSLSRISTNALAYQLKNIPLSENRLRGEGIIP